MLLRGDPAEAQVAEIVDLVGTIDDRECAGDAAAWFAAQPDPAAAAAALAAEITTADREAIVVLSGLGVFEDVVGERAVATVRPQLGGPHDGLVVNWLVGQDALDPATIAPSRFVSGVVDVLAVALDNAGPEELFECLGEMDRSKQLLDVVWRLDHPGCPTCSTRSAPDIRSSRWPRPPARRWCATAAGWPACRAERRRARSRDRGPAR